MKTVKIGIRNIGSQPPFNTINTYQSGGHYTVAWCVTSCLKLWDLQIYLADENDDRKSNLKAEDFTFSFLKPSSIKGKVFEKSPDSSQGQEGVAHTTTWQANNPPPNRVTIFGNNIYIHVWQLTREYRIVTTNTNVMDMDNHYPAEWLEVKFYSKSTGISGYGLYHLL